LQNSLPRLLLAGWGSLGTLFGRLLCGSSAQVVLAHPPHRFSSSSEARQPTLLVAGYDRFSAVFFKEQREDRKSPLIWGRDKNAIFYTLKPKIF